MPALSTEFSFFTLASTGRTGVSKVNKLLAQTCHVAMDLPPIH